MMSVYYSGYYSGNPSAYNAYDPYPPHYIYPPYSYAPQAYGYAVSSPPPNMLITQPFSTTNAYTPYDSPYHERQYPGVVYKIPPHYAASFNPASVPYRQITNVAMPDIAPVYYNTPATSRTPSASLPTIPPPLMDLSHPQDGTLNPLMRYYMPPQSYPNLQEAPPSRLPIEQIIRPSNVIMPHDDKMNPEFRPTSFFESTQRIEHPNIGIPDMSVSARPEATGGGNSDLLDQIKGLFKK
jgi:hypothetical protein